MTNNTIKTKGRGVRVAAPREGGAAIEPPFEGQGRQAEKALAEIGPSAKHEVGRAKARPYNCKPSTKHEEGRAKARAYNCKQARRKEKRRRIRSAQDGDVKPPRQTCGAGLQKTLDGVEIWKQFEDLLIPRLGLTPIERAVYSHLLRHSRLEGQRKLRFSILWAARGSGLSMSTVRKGVRQLAAKGALRLTERSKRGHVIEVLLPEEIEAVRSGRSTAGKLPHVPSAAELESTDFLQRQALREAIHARECGRCFYCLRRVKAATRCIDHVIPQARNGSNSYRNLVSSCAECNAQKCDWSAEDFLRWLYREGRLGASELKERLSELEKLADGQLRPRIMDATSRKGGAIPLSRGGRETVGRASVAL